MLMRLPLSSPRSPVTLRKRAWMAAAALGVSITAEKVITPVLRPPDSSQ